MLISATFIANAHLSFSLHFLFFFSQSTIVSSTVNGVASGGAPTMYRPNFSQAFQRAGPTTVPPTLSAGLYPTQSFTSSLLSNGIQSNTGYWCYMFILSHFWSFAQLYNVKLCDITLHSALIDKFLRIILLSIMFFIILRYFIRVQLALQWLYRLTLGTVYNSLTLCFLFLARAITLRFNDSLILFNDTFRWSLHAILSYRFATCLV